MGNAPGVTRIYVEKKEAFADESRTLLHDLQTNLGKKKLNSLRILIRYDFDRLPPAIEVAALPTIFSEPPVDHLHIGSFPHSKDDRILTVELLPGQYDQRADSAAQCIQLLSSGSRIRIRAAKTYVFSGSLTEQDLLDISRYLINPVDSRQACENLPETLDQALPVPESVPIISGFCRMTGAELADLNRELGLAMSEADLLFCQGHFRQEEQRDPSLTELRLLDTYWSDHCRHTTFMAAIDRVDIEEGLHTRPIKVAWETFRTQARDFFDPDHDLTLMRLATFSMKRAKSLGRLEDLEESGEINACSIVRPVDVDGKSEPWLIMFKNETHNHPTEIEPYGGAATCLGGAIRDPLSGRSYVYQAMRVTGAADPTRPVETTLPGKLPQRKITREAAAGYSGYGNQIGLATGLVHEYYHPGYVAKRMEVGAVIGAVPQRQVRREEPIPGDKIILIGGRTGRDGIGGATGSSKTHTESSIETAGSEVQKGNAPEERKLQRLFRDPAFTRLVKKSNDFGAGGVSVAIGELAPGLEIDLDRVPKKYEGLDGTELAVSESQERMAVVVAEGDVGTVLRLAAAENLEASVIAEVREEPRLRMTWRGETIVDLARSFLDSSGVQLHTEMMVTAPAEQKAYFRPIRIPAEKWKQTWLDTLSDLNVCSQQGLNERFDNTVGAATVHMPYGGSRQASPIETMVAKVPVLDAVTTTASAMSFGYDPDLSQWSPFHGGLYAVVEALSKLAAAGAEPDTARFSLQEYFEKPRNDPRRWGKPFAALLGANHAMSTLGLAAIGGKDSMSGSFNELDVPPTLIAFAVTTLDARCAVSPEIKAPGHALYLLRTPIDAAGMPDFTRLSRHFAALHGAVEKGCIASARAVHRGGCAAALTKMALGNQIGIELDADLDDETLFSPLIGSILLEWQGELPAAEFFRDCDLILMGKTLAEPLIRSSAEPNHPFTLCLDEAFKVWSRPLADIFPQGQDLPQLAPEIPLFEHRTANKPVRIARPRVIIPTFPGSNCEYDCQQNFNRAGADAHISVFCNQSAQAITDSIIHLSEGIEKSQILMIPGGFSAGDEPDGSGKFIAAVLRNPRVYEALQTLLNRGGLILGVCNGFQALIKTGLLPYGELRTPEAHSPTLTFNSVGRYISRMVHTRIVSTLSPWLWNRAPGEVYQIAIAHGEGRFIAPEETIKALAEAGQLATQYVAPDGHPGQEYRDNPNGSLWAVEGISSPDGRIFGKMGHNERHTAHTQQNIPGIKDDRLFASGVDFFR
jgi:phosphoribosylformylglycinamidine synthase